MIITGPIETFFKSPSLKPSPGGDGILFHLRRDLEKLYGSESDCNIDASPYLMLSMMGILAGIDYLSKVYSPQSSSRSRKKFVETVKELCNVTNEDAEAIYLFRCALVHSYALSIKSKSMGYKPETRFNFNISDGKSLPLIQKPSEVGGEVTYQITFWKLKEAFLEVIRKLENIARDVNHPRNAHVVNMIGRMHSEKILYRK